jgi:hypothetical protein
MQGAALDPGYEMVDLPDVLDRMSFAHAPGMG